MVAMKTWLPLLLAAVGVQLCKCSTEPPWNIQAPNLDDIYKSGRLWLEPQELGVRTCALHGVLSTLGCAQNHKSTVAAAALL
jgi:hypothetical protein